MEQNMVAMTEQLSLRKQKLEYKNDTHWKVMLFEWYKSRLALKQAS